MSLLKNPFLILEVIEETFDYNAIDSLLKTVQILRRNPDKEKFEVYREMILFSVIYNAFRPTKISHSDEYYETVTTIDDVYRKLSGFLEIDQPTIFSKSFTPRHGSYSLNSSSKDQKIKWDDLIGDLDFVTNAVKKTMNSAAFQLAINGDASLPFNIRKLAIEYIKSLDERLNDSNVNIVFGSVGEIIIFGSKIKWISEYHFKEYLRKMEGA